MPVKSRDWGCNESSIITDWHDLKCASKSFLGELNPFLIQLTMKSTGNSVIADSVPELLNKSRSFIIFGIRYYWSKLCFNFVIDCFNFYNNSFSRSILGNCPCNFCCIISKSIYGCKSNRNFLNCAAV